MGTEGKSDRELLLEIHESQIEVRGDVRHLRESHEDLKRDHEDRLRAIEHDAWKQSGAFGILGVIASAFVAWLISVFKDGKH